MKIVVCIKQVPDTTEIRLDPVTGTLIRDGVPSIMNPDDKAGLEMALELKDQYGAHVTVITMGPPQADDILREAFAMGADRAIHLSDRKFAGADTLATSNAIAGALRMLEFDLVITGRQAIDGDTAQVGPQIAEHLGLPQVTYLEGIKYEGGNRLVVKKWTEEGYQLLEKGGYIDLTCGISEEFCPGGCILEAKEKGIPTEHITISSDGHGSWSKYREDGSLLEIGVSSVDALREELLYMVHELDMKLEDALPYMTSHVAEALGLQGKKGTIQKGADADLLLWDNDLKLDSYIAGGKIFMQKEKIICKGTYEK